jgi:putative nucleotidyltransferase with HDIG domain
MTREEAVKLIEQNVSDANLRKHMLAVEAVMRALARRFGESEQDWALAGLLHDLDYEKTAQTPEKHGLVTCEMLSQCCVPEQVIRTIKAHNNLVEPQTRAEKAIICADNITGLVVACALVQPDKKIASVKTNSVKKKMKDKRFAAGVSREAILSCEGVGLTLDEFIDLSIAGMAAIAQELGL